MAPLRATCRTFFGRKSLEYKLQKEGLSLLLRAQNEMVRGGKKIYVFLKTKRRSAARRGNTSMEEDDEKF